MPVLRHFISLLNGTSANLNLLFQKLLCTCLDNILGTGPPLHHVAFGKPERAFPNFQRKPQPADLDPSKMCAMDIDEMPNLRGQVCQLNYNCSGMLEPLPMSGLPKHVPFLKSPLSLRVGQAVRFRIVSRGDDVQAVEISLESEVRRHQEREMLDLAVDAGCLNTSSTLTAGKMEMSQFLEYMGDVMSSVPTQSHSKCFLRRMSQFRNACQAEQLQLVMEAERSLDKLLAQTTLDGDAICRLARKCASWLHPPVLQTANPLRVPLRQSAQMSERGTEDQVHLQERIRKILIEALNHLDLQDPSTFEAMKAALFYMASLCQRLNEKYSSSSATVATTPAKKQWLELISLLEDSGLKSLASDGMSYQRPCPRVEDESKRGTLPRAANTQDQMKEMADAVRVACVEREHEPKRRHRIAEYYEPTPKIKALSTVSQGTPVKLMCSECPFTMTSSWYFQHPKTLKRSVIAPQRGHDTCQQKVKKRCFWRSLDGGPVVGSFVSNLEYCPHKRLLDHCASCGGGRVCIHAKRRHQCKECRHLYVGRRGPKDVGNAESGDIMRNLILRRSGRESCVNCNLQGQTHVRSTKGFGASLPFDT